MKVDYAIVFVSDMKRSVAFYRDVVGMPLKFESPHWTEFATDGATWALHQSETDNKDALDDLELPAGRCRSGFSVPDLDSFHARMMEHKVRCLHEPKLTFGVRIAQYLDPDGMSFGVSEVKTG